MARSASPHRRWELAPTFVNADLDTSWLEEFAAKLPATSHSESIGWLEARLNLKSLPSQVEQSSGRIAELVKAIKSYTYMDQSPMQEIDIHVGIESTLTMLNMNVDLLHRRLIHIRVRLD